MSEIQKVGGGNSDSKVGRIMAERRLEERSKVGFLTADSGELHSEMWANRDNLKEQLGNNTEITNIRIGQRISSTDNNGQKFDGVLVTVSYNAPDNGFMGSGRMTRKAPIEMVIDSKGHFRYHSERQAPYPNSPLRRTFQGAGRLIFPSFEKKYK